MSNVWKEVISKYCSYCAEEYTENTSKLYTTTVKDYFDFTYHGDLENVDLKMVTKASIDDYLSSLVDASQMTLYTTSKALNNFAKFLSDNGYINNNVKIEVEYKRSSQNIKILSHQEIMDVVNTDIPIRGRFIILLAYENMLKLSDIVNLKYDDLDFINKKITLGERVDGLSEQVVDVGTHYVSELKSSINEWNKNRIRKGWEEREEQGYVFQTRKSVVPTQSAIQRPLKDYFKSYCELTNKDLSVPPKDITVEVLRDSRRLYLLQQGYTVYQVLEMTNSKNYDAVGRLVKFINK